jgi:transcriptional regulator NrdR family protein
MNKSYQVCAGCGEILTAEQIKKNLRAESASIQGQRVCENCYKRYHLRTVEEILGHGSGRKWVGLAD